MTDLDIDYLAKDPRDVQLRWMDLSQKSRELLSGMAGIVRSLDPENALSDLEPIDVAKGLVSIYYRLPLWVGRTQRLSANARLVRQLFKQASDPTASFLMTFLICSPAEWNRVMRTFCGLSPAMCMRD